MDLQTYSALIALALWHAGVIRNNIILMIGGGILVALCTAAMT